MILHPGLLYFFILSIEDLKFTRHSIYSLLNLSFFFKILQLSLLTFLLVFNPYVRVFKFGFTGSLPSEGIGVCPFEGVVVNDLAPRSIYYFRVIRVDYSIDFTLLQAIITKFNFCGGDTFYSSSPLFLYYAFLRFLFLFVLIGSFLSGPPSDSNDLLSFILVLSLSNIILKFSIYGLDYCPCELMFTLLNVSNSFLSGAFLRFLSIFILGLYITFFAGDRLYLKFVLYIKFCYGGLFGWHMLFFLLLFPHFYISFFLSILLDLFLADLYFNLFNKSLPALFLIWDFFLFLIRLRSDYCAMYEELLKILPAYQFLRNLRSILGNRLLRLIFLYFRVSGFLDYLDLILSRLRTIYLIFNYREV